ncbi:MAG TPA: arylesterase [Burkholderiales bacterium]|nr:arylesterase [Burkholderiales bacterium]
MKYSLLLCLLLPTAAHARAVLMVFGDSLSAGYGLASHQAWPDLLQQRLANDRNIGQRWTVVNASVSGETTAGGLARLPAALNAYHPALVVLELGANDGLRGLPLSAMRENLLAMIRNIKKSGAKILLVGVHLPSNYGMPYTERFRQVYIAVAQQNDLPLVPSLLAGIETEPGLFQADGLHPVAAAETRIVDTVWPALLPMLSARRVSMKPEPTSSE